MEKTIKIDGKDTKFKFSVSSFYVFKNQFGYDGIQRLLPVIGEILQNLDSKVFSAGEGDFDVLLETVGEILVEQTYFEITEVLNLLWAFAKTADKEIPEPELWFEQFDEFPLYDVMRELVPVLIESLVTKKR